MATNNEVLNKLDKIETGLDFEEENRPLRIDDCSSFLSDKKPIPSNDELKNIPAFKKSFEAFEKHDKDFDNLFKPENIYEQTKCNLEYNDIFSKGKKGCDDEFNNKIMLIALNRAGRDDGIDRSNRNQFHDHAGHHETNMLRLRIQLNDINYQGCYITDALKNTINSSSSKVMYDFFLKGKNHSNLDFTTDAFDEDRAQFYLENNDKTSVKCESIDQALKMVEKNKKTFEQSIAILIQEIHAVNPENIIVLGNSANEMIENMFKSSKFNDEYSKNALNHAITATHYADQHNQDYRAWINSMPQQLAASVKEQQETV